MWTKWLQSLIYYIKGKGLSVRIPIVRWKFGKARTNPMYKFSTQSLERLNTCHPDLIRLFNEVIKGIDCSVLCGYRGQEEQEKAFNFGTSKLHFPASKHNGAPSRAVDVMRYPINWTDDLWNQYFAGYVQGVADQLGIKVVWGGSWLSFVDKPHWEIKHESD
jgi:peptidoglycan L-alanyl-D-glutamate endopeptidase CwlK